MSTNIEWTDETWNPVVGCTKVSQGCKHCYAKTLHDKRHKAQLAGKKMHPQYAEPFETVQLMEKRLEQPLHWRKSRRIFVNSVSDLFHEDVPSWFLDGVFATMALCGALAKGHLFQVLTKRPERAYQYLTSRTPEAWAEALAGVATDLYGEENGNHVANSIAGVLGDGHNVGWPLRNLALGTSTEDPKTLNERAPWLLGSPAAIRFLSAEPLLASIENELGIWLCLKANADGDIAEEADVRGYDRPGVGWVIVGGESGPKARPCDVAWIRQVVRVCKQTDVPCFVKQLGSVPMMAEAQWRESPPSRVPLLNARNDRRVPDGFVPLKYSKKGGEIAEWPEPLRVREFPAGAA